MKKRNNIEEFEFEEQELYDMFLEHLGFSEEELKKSFKSMEN